MVDEIMESESDSVICYHDDGSKKQGVGGKNLYMLLIYSRNPYCVISPMIFVMLLENIFL